MLSVESPGLEFWFKFFLGILTGKATLLSDQPLQSDAFDNKKKGYNVKIVHIM